MIRSVIRSIANETAIAQFGEAMTLTNLRVMGRTANDAENGAILLENVVFCGIATRYPSVIVFSIGAALLLLSVFLPLMPGFNSNPTEGRLGLALIGALMLIWYFTNRQSVLVVNSANGSLSESLKGSGSSEAASTFVARIQAQQLEVLRKPIENIGRAASV